MSGPLVLFTDYGLEGPWVGLLHAVIQQGRPGAQIIDLQHDLPPFRPRGAGILLAAQRRWLPRGATVVAVVDPGVGTARGGLLVECEGVRLIGPDNGLLAPFFAGARYIRCIDWMPGDIPATFHGRDWFVPAALRLLSGEALATTELSPSDCVGHDWPERLDEIIYIDRFGNLITGIPASSAPEGAQRRLAGHVLPYAHTFGEVSPGDAFWHRNSLGLIEIAVNQGSAAERFGLRVGDPV